MEHRVGIEYIKVFCDFDENGQTKCICARSHKKCNKKCTPEVVERDRYRGWQKLFRQDKYGKTKD